MKAKVNIKIGGSNYKNRSKQNYSTGITPIEFRSTPILENFSKSRGHSLEATAVDFNSSPPRKNSNKRGLYKARSKQEIEHSKGYIFGGVRKNRLGSEVDPQQSLAISVA